MAQPEAKIGVWDWPVRLSHWGFALLIPAMWYTAEYSHWGWHKRFGLVLLGLLIFRILWGFIGTRTARFASFVKGPGAVLATLRGRFDHGIGHSPIGALSVLALLLAMSIQVGMGLFAGDPYDGMTGPLNSLVSVATADWLTDTHEWFYWVVLGLVALHLAAIAFYAAVKRKNLVGPMVTGKRAVDGAGEGGAEGAGEGAGEGANDAPRLLALVLAIGTAAGLALWAAYGAPAFG